MRKDTIELPDGEYIGLYQQRIKSLKRLLIILLSILLLVFTTTIGFEGSSCCNCESVAISKCHKILVTIQMCLAVCLIVGDLVVYSLDAHMFAVVANNKKNITVKDTYKRVYHITVISVGIIISGIAVLLGLSTVLYWL